MSTSLETDVPSLRTSDRHITVTNSDSRALFSSRSSIGILSSPSTKAIVKSLPESAVVSSCGCFIFQHRISPVVEDAPHPTTVTLALDLRARLAHKPSKAVGRHSYLNNALQMRNNVETSHASPSGSAVAFGNSSRTYARAFAEVPSPDEQSKLTLSRPCSRASSTIEQSRRDKCVILLSSIRDFFTHSGSDNNCCRGRCGCRGCGSKGSCAWCCSREWDIACSPRISANVRRYLHQ